MAGLIVAMGTTLFYCGGRGHRFAWRRRLPSLDMTFEAPSGPASSPEVSLGRIEQRLAEVAGTLGRLDDGSYGRCEVCGSVIGAERLEGDPLARRCPDCETPPT